MTLVTNMAVLIDRLHFLVLFCFLFMPWVRVNAIEEFLGQCDYTINLISTQRTSGILSMPMPSNLGRACDMQIIFENSMHLMVELYYVDIISTGTNSTNCQTGLEITDQTGRNYYGKRLCEEASVWVDKAKDRRLVTREVMNSPLTIRLASDSSYKGNGFKLHFNQFRPTLPCWTREYKCENQRCVHDDLTCDGWDDCGDLSDEKYAAGCDRLTPTEICALIIGIFLLLGSIFATVMFIVIHRRLKATYGVVEWRSESKVPIAEDRYSLDPTINMPFRYNSQESLGKYSRSTVPTITKRDSDLNIVDRVDLEKTDRLSNRAPDNMSERSYRSRRSKMADPVRKGHNASLSSLNREKDLVEGIVDPLTVKLEDEKDRRSLDRDRRNGRDPDRDRYSDDDLSDYERRRRRRSRRDDRYSDDDSDYDRDRDRRRRRRSYDRYSDDSDYEYERERERRRRSRDRYSRDRYDDRDGSDRDREKDINRDIEKRPPSHKGSRERDIDRDIEKRPPSHKGSRERDIDRDMDRRPPGRQSSRERDRDRERDIDRDLERRPHSHNGSRERDIDRDMDRRPPDRQGSRERDRDRSRRDRERRRSPYEENDDRPYRRRRTSSERRRDTERDREKLKNAEIQQPPKYEEKSSEFLPPPPSGEDIQHMDLENESIPPPPYEATFDFKPIADYRNQPKAPPVKTNVNDQVSEPSNLEKQNPPKPQLSDPNFDDQEKRKVNEKQRKQKQQMSDTSFDGQDQRQRKEIKSQPKVAPDGQDPRRRTENIRQPSATPDELNGRSPRPRTENLNQPKALSSGLEGRDPRQRTENLNQSKMAPNNSRATSDVRGPRRSMEKPKPPPVDVVIDEGNRRRSTDNRRERYSRDRWQPKGKKPDSPPPEYEDVAPKTIFVDAGYKEEAV